MLCYNEDDNAKRLYSMLNTLNKKLQIELLYNIFRGHKINITQPDDIYIQFWNVGMHYCKPNFNISEELNQLKELNIEIIGEIVNDTHGWIESALNTVH